MPVTDFLCKLALATTQHTEAPASAARIALWLSGLALRNGGFPVTVSYRQIRIGLPDKGGYPLVGTKCHLSTIKASLQWLEEARILDVTAVGRGVGASAAVTIQPR